MIGSTRFLFLSSLVAAGPTTDPGIEQRAPRLFQALQGAWSCSGAFANGRPLNADLRFELALGGQGLRFHHDDRAPSPYAQEALWSVDENSRKLISLAWIRGAANRPLSAAVYEAEDIEDDGITLRQQRLFTDPWANNLFHYQVRGKSLRVTWEVEKAGTWVTGDILECRQTRPAKRWRAKLSRRPVTLRPTRMPTERYGRA